MIDINEKEEETPKEGEREEEGRSDDDTNPDRKNWEAKN